MQDILKINDRGNVRDAVPLRAIPYVTSWKDTPDGIVRTLAAPKTIRKMGFEISSRQNNLFAYQMDAQGHFEQVPPEQWESWVVTLNSLTLKLQADEREDADGENWAPWRIKAVLELPDNVFVWLDEFQRWHSLNRPLAVPDDYWNDCLKWESNHESLLAKFHDPNSKLSESEWAMLDVAPPELEQENDRLCLTPIFPPEIKNRLWRYAEGFVTAEQVGTKASAAAKVESAPHDTPEAKVEADKGTTAKTNKLIWDDAMLRALYEESILPGVTQTGLAIKHGVSRQRIGNLLKQAKAKFGSGKPSQYSLSMAPNKIHRGNKY